MTASFSLFVCAFSTTGFFVFTDIVVRSDGGFVFLMHIAGEVLMGK